VLIGFLVVIVQLTGINGKFNEIRSDLKAILEEIGNEYEDTPGGKKLVWGVKHILGDILEEIGNEYEDAPGGKKLVKWGVKEILGDILEEIKSKN
jgi:hypothetical protein